MLNIVFMATLLFLSTQFRIQLKSVCIPATAAWTELNCVTRASFGELMSS